MKKRNKKIIISIACFLVGFGLNFVACLWILPPYLNFSMMGISLFTMVCALIVIIKNIKVKGPWKKKNEEFIERLFKNRDKAHARRYRIK